MFAKWEDPEHWKKYRTAMMTAARGCRIALIRPDGVYRLSADDACVKIAVGKWVARARRAHALAMGREPVIERFSFIINEGIAYGSIYADAGFVPRAITNPETHKAKGTPL